MPINYTSVTCNQCAGSGWVDPSHNRQAPEICPGCDGSGKVPVPSRIADDPQNPTLRDWIITAIVIAILAAGVAWWIAAHHAR
jgi:hypothetical protein